MQPSNRAMIWYFWRMSRISIVYMTAFCLSAAFFIKMGRGTESPAPSAYEHMLAQVFLMMAGGACLFVRRGEHMFTPPPHLLTVPLTTKKYVGLLYGYLIIVMGVFACAITALHFHLFGSVIRDDMPPVVLAMWTMPLLCISLVCALQSLCHVSATGSIPRLVQSAVPMTLTALLIAMPLLNPAHPGWHSGAPWPQLLLDFASIYSYGGVPWSLLLISLSFTTSYSAIAACRKGCYGSGIAGLISASETRGGRSRSFATPGWALFWLGWRRHGRIYFMGTLMFSLVSLAVGLSEVYGHADRAGALPEFLCMPVLLSSALLCACVILVRDGADLYRAGQGYFLTLPVRSAEFARGRLLAMAFSLALVMSAVALTADATMLLFILPSMPQTGPFLPTFACATLFITVLAWIAIWFGFWSGLCLSIISLVSALGSLFHCWISPNTILTIFTAILIIPGTVAIVVIAHRRNAFDRTNRLSATFALIPGFLSGILSGVFLDYPRVDVIMILLFTLLTPLPFAAVPLAFDWLRHR